ncbi:PDR/VanB family oxidoreductase [Acidiphilium iwatense]|uniref:PDR/VanB family oxidoreductase n=1 Tax=Acidiphilium iwatense TaxID=768198 RepID=A0ABS9E2D6_9PROT|nr:PDR/VanB family oxidoreductase [Acidiphilium iwatense]MCF3948205.1 PDR/VanB family oxidoreductase [Acidiphilium iwatense]
MSSKDLLQAQVRTLRYEAEGIISIEMMPIPGAHFPRFDAGSHIDFHLPNGLIRNYSLLNSPDDNDRYVVGVLADRQSRGGSRYVHEQFRCGMVVPISAPRNNFTLDESASQTVLVAGGIGITPILCMYRRLRALGRDVRLAYCARTRSHAAFSDELRAIGGDIHFHFDDENGGSPFNLLNYLSKQPGDAHVYCCGPSVMISAFEKACEAANLKNVHIERFSIDPVVQSAPKAGCTVQLAKSGKTFEVQADKTILDALLEAGIDVEFGCKEGICGACETNVLSGYPDHRDGVLSQAEKDSNKVMMICVSRVKSGPIVLDL